MNLALDLASNIDNSNDIDKNHNNKNNNTNYLKIYEGNSKNEEESAGDEKAVKSSIHEDIVRMFMQQLWR